MRATPEALSMWGTRVLLRAPQDVEERVGSLVLPEQAQDRQRYRQWEVVAVGARVRELALAPGARVLVSGQWVGEPVRWGDAEYRVVFEEQVIALL